MILVNAPLKRDYIKGLLDQQTIDGITFVFEKQDGMKMYFNHDGDPTKAQSVIKKTIKSSEFGSVLFFNVEIL
ncbi:MAG: hypothetical protein KGZ51_07830 [Erysipelothrix sp.]|jgi:hypothetical protein|nr:hypothetical protein [Erysipelothrix sp.]